MNTQDADLKRTAIYIAESERLKEERLLRLARERINSGKAISISQAKRQVMLEDEKNKRG